MAALEPAAAWVGRLSLTDFRSYARTEIEAGPGPVAITGANGAGKTNLLEALSLLAPGRGLRGAALSEMARDTGAGGWAVAARLEGAGAGAGDLGTGTLASAPERRVARTNGAGVPVGAFGERLALSWLTPAMDRLLADSASARRRFLDRLTLALVPGHGRHAARYEAAMRERTRLLTGKHADGAWLGSLERAMGENGAALARARAETVTALAPWLDATEAPFPAARLALDDYGLDAESFARELGRRRGIDTAAGRATMGPHRAQLTVTHVPSGQPAPRASTGEQKALLIGILLAHAALVAERRGARPILLLDEVAAHLDAGRRAALFARLPALGQVWVTGTEAALFDGLEAGTRLEVSGGVVRVA
jgi:DNA replication and repair protein RecF